MQPTGAPSQSNQEAGRCGSNKFSRPHFSPSLDALDVLRPGIDDLQDAVVRIAEGDTNKNIGWVLTRPASRPSHLSIFAEENGVDVASHPVSVAVLSNKAEQAGRQGIVPEWVGVDDVDGSLGGVGV
jgi:hypothetical protein